VLVAWFLSRVLIGSGAGILVDRWNRKQTMVRTDLGVADAVGLVAPGPAALMLDGAFFVLAGFPVVAAMTAPTTLLQSRTTDAYRGRVFGAPGAVEGLATMVGRVVGGAPGDGADLVAVLSGGAAMWVAGGAVAFVLLPRASDRPRPAGEAAHQ
jgi:hypothetical protein